MSTRAVHVTHPMSTTRPSVPRLGTGRRILRATALAATLPYLTLKAAWLAGSRAGIPEGSILLKGGTALTVANAVTVAMDACVILLVLVLTRPWGLRVPGPLLTVPVFAATGLLTPIVLGYPAQLLVKALGAGAGEAAGAAREPFLDAWVFAVVYSGFIIQAIALAGLFVPYARERWGRRLQGALGLGVPPAGGWGRLPSPTGVAAGAAALAGAVAGAVQLYWAFGGTGWLPAERAAAYSADARVVSGVHALCAFAAAAGALMLARGGARPARWPLALTWIGGSAALSWGAWTLIAVLGVNLGEGEPSTTGFFLTYADQMITGLLAGVVLVRHLRARGEG
ncbi:hypothetical protein BX286_1970 [Streptomyces sp. 3211.6]|uniref:hypothetical protein n=1 Tax=Streptomyces sp. 3211.6 TaxID=1938845 RepID=UPI000F2329B1|nr:hypothetical protein [Streptomyces sp. 3211.6]RKT04026.1 hypothetical protein BX286_1970 [Streptomyces sp. 3211.6]